MADDIERLDRVAATLDKMTLTASAQFVRDAVAEITRLRAELAVKDGAVVVKALERIKDLADNGFTPPEGVETRIAWIEAELTDEPNRPMYGSGDEVPCRNGHEISDLIVECVGLIARSSLVSAPSVKDGALSDALREVAQLKIGNRILDALVAEKCALLLTAEARASAAEAERDEARTNLDALKSDAISDRALIVEANEKRRAAEAREAGLRAALEPFAKAATDCGVEDDLRIGVVKPADIIWESAVATSITFGDVDRARATLSPETQVEP